MTLRSSVPTETHTPPDRSPDILTIIAAVLIVGLGVFFLALGMTTFRLSDGGERPVCPSHVPCQTRGPEK